MEESPALVELRKLQELWKWQKTFGPGMVDHMVWNQAQVCIDAIHGSPEEREKAEIQTIIESPWFQVQLRARIAEKIGVTLP